jgi:Uma2 family endonuclease
MTIWEAFRVRGSAAEEPDLPGDNVEILAGRIVLSPAPTKLHSRIVTRLCDGLQAICTERGWDRWVRGTIELPATSERIQPDLFVSPADESAEWLIPGRRCPADSGGRLALQPP